MFNQVYEKVIFFEDQVYDWGRFQKNGPAHLYQNYPQVTSPPPPPPRGLAVSGPSFSCTPDKHI